MLDLKAKLLAAGLVTADQVKKVEDEEADKKRKAEERKAARGGDKRDRKGRDVDEKVAERDHKEEEAQRWRKRLDELKAAGKAEQYEVVRGWVTRHRLDDKTAVPSEQASRFHFARDDGTIGHVTLEPDVQQRLAAGEAGIIAFLGFNGLEHAVVPADLARDIAYVKPEWLRSLAGVTDVETTSPSAPAEAIAAESIAPEPTDAPAKDESEPS
jgi:uncharacterized protein YaiL (DUF2058 family)